MPDDTDQFAAMLYLLEEEERAKARQAERQDRKGQATAEDAAAADATRAATSRHEQS